MLCLTWESIAQYGSSNLGADQDVNQEILFLSKWPTWCTILFCAFIVILNSLHVSSTLCSSSGETNCVTTTSGSCHSVSVAMSCAGPTCKRHGHWHRVTATRGCSDTICLSWWWAQCAHHQERQIASIQPLVAVGGHVMCRSDLQTTWPMTQSDSYQRL